MAALALRLLPLLLGLLCSVCHCSTEPLTAVSDIKCRFYAKKTFRCSFRNNNTDQAATSCTICPLFSRFNDTTNCSSGLYKDHNMCRTAPSCNYNCTSYYCNLSYSVRIKVKVTVGSGTDEVETCKLFKHPLRTSVEPSRVSNVRVFPVSTTALNVTWTKPDDHDNDNDVYNYRVKCRVNNTVRLKSKDQDLMITVGDLEPWTKYTCKVTARFKKGFRSQPVYGTNRTLEDVPAEPPRIPDSVSIQGELLAVYWQNLSAKMLRGQLESYLLQVGDEENWTLGVSTYWHQVNISGRREVNIRLRARTRAGPSEATTLDIDVKSIGKRQVTSVHRKGNKLVWTYRPSTPTTVNTPLSPSAVANTSNSDYFRVHRCYGRQTQDNPQLVNCTNAIQFDIVSSNNITLEERPPGNVSCSNCDWQYGVSPYTAKMQSAMVWSTKPSPEPKVAKHVSPADDTLKMALVIGGAVVVCSVFLVSALCLYLKKKDLCATYLIILPKMSLADTSGPDRLSPPPEDRQQLIPEPHPRPQHVSNLKDSGIVSMADHREDSAERMLRGKQNDQQEDQEVHEESKDDVALVAEDGEDATAQEGDAWADSESESDMSIYRFAGNIVDKATMPDDMHPGSPATLRRQLDLAKDDLTTTSAWLSVSAPVCGRTVFTDPSEPSVPTSIPSSIPSKQDVSAPTPASSSNTSTSKKSPSSTSRKSPINCIAKDCLDSSTFGEDSSPECQVFVDVQNDGGVSFKCAQTAKSAAPANTVEREDAEISSVPSSLPSEGKLPVHKHKHVQSGGQHTETGAPQHKLPTDTVEWKASSGDAPDGSGVSSYATVSVP